MGRHRSRSVSPKSPERSVKSSSNWDGSSGHRIHISDLATGITRREVERAFTKYGPINEIWVATNPPCFAFINFTNRSDAEKAMREVDGKIIGSTRVGVSWARDRTYGSRSRGGRGGRGGRGAPYGSYRSQRRSRSRSRSNSRHQKRRHSRSRSRDRHRRRSVSPRDRKQSRRTSTEKNENDRQSQSHHVETTDENNTHNRSPLIVDNE